MVQPIASRPTFYPRWYRRSLAGAGASSLCQLPQVWQSHSDGVPRGGGVALSVFAPDRECLLLLPEDLKRVILLIPM